MKPFQAVDKDYPVATIVLGSMLIALLLYGIMFAVLSLDTIFPDLRIQHSSDQRSPAPLEQSVTSEEMNTNEYHPY